MITSPDQIVFRASGIGKIMAEPRSKSEVLAETVKTHLIDVFASAMYSRREEIDNKFLAKGNDCEEDSITLLSRITKNFYIKNRKRMTDEFFTGEWDLQDSMKAISETTDIKTSWSLHTFLRSTGKKLSNDYFYQGQTYMHLTGAKRHHVAFCLVNGTPDAIDNEKRKLTYQKGMLDHSGNESEIYIARCKQIEVNHIFDLKEFLSKYPHYHLHSDLSAWDYDIPKERRVHVFSFERNDEVIEAMIQRVKECRAWISENFKDHFANQSKLVTA